MRQRTTGGPLPGLPFNTVAADARSEIVTVLGSWGGLVAEERQLRAPRRTVTALARFLIVNAEWLLAHAAGAEAADEVMRLAGRARWAAHPEPVRQIALGGCVEPRCAGRLVAWVHTCQGQAHTEVRCDADERHTWAESQWTRLWRSTLGSGVSPTAPGSATTSKPSERGLTASHIARLWDVPVGTVYRLASELGWRRRRRAGRTYYAERDVHECFSRRTLE